jgi:hypothetical protein
MAGRFFIAVIYCMITGCNMNLEKSQYRIEPEISSIESTPLSSRVGFCQVHHTPLKARGGFTFGERVVADPIWDYVRFLDTERFPNVTPWSFSSKRSEAKSAPTTVKYCPQCDDEFEGEFEKFRQLTEPEKQAYFEALLRRQIQKKKARTRRAVTTPTSRSVYMFYRNYTTNPVINVRRRW